MYFVGTDDFNNFSTLLSEKIYKLTRHHYISSSQEIFLQNLKSNLLINEVIVLLDFSENFSFIIQDKAQGFHWGNSQCTVHLFLVNHRKSDDDETTHKRICFFSPNTKHNISMVYTFISALMPEIKCFISELSKIYYFSDGCAGQYKNRFNFVNLYYHKMDFNAECECHFFTTSRGKSACDEIGKVVKRLTTKATLKRPFKNQILTPQVICTFCKENFGKKISFLYF